MAYQSLQNISVEGAHLMFCNFEGRKREFNEEGKRNFCLVVSENPTLLQRCNDLGIRVKSYVNKTTGKVDYQYVQIAVRFDNVPPTIVLIANGYKTVLTESNVAMLDSMDIANVDLVIHPHAWSKYGRSGVKPYLRTMYVTMEEDNFAKKYANIPIATDSPGIVAPAYSEASQSFKSDGEFITTKDVDADGFEPIDNDGDDDGELPF